MSDPGAILEFESVRFAVPPGERWDVGLSGASFSLRGGELAVVQLEPGRPRHPLPGLACGTVAPDGGSVRALGSDWETLSADEAAARRGRIGQVFGEAGFLSSLDLDENITLPLRHHARLPPAAARAAAREWARRFGLDDLPSVRPAWADRDTLRVAQWIRAFSVRPELLLLDRPADGMAGPLRARLVDAVETALARGAAALWLTAESDAPQTARRFRCRGVELTCSNPGDPP